MTPRRKEPEAVTSEAAAPKAPYVPSFGMSEGTREELERTGHAVDPFTSEKLTKDGT